MINFVSACLLVLFAALSRLIPHPANFTPVIAIALFSGVYLDKKFAFVIPLAAMLISDVIIGWHPTVLWVYGALVISVFIGLWLKSHKKALYIAGGALISSIIFFLVTNLGMWATGYYGYTFGGLMQSYAMAIPFFRNSLLGDMFYTGVLFGLYHLIISVVRKPELQTKKID